MREIIPAIKSIRARSRKAALLGLFALALLQISIAAHQFEHIADHGLNVCDACTAYSKLDDAPLAGATPSEFPVALNGAISTLSDTPDAAGFNAAYRSRAPPLS